MSADASGQAGAAPAWRPPPLTRAHWAIPLALIAAATAAILAFDLDLPLARRFYALDGPPAWPRGFEAPWGILYQWGVLPSELLGVLGVLLLAAGYASPPRRRERWAGAVLLLGLIIGPLIVTSALQANWGRPRPRQVQEFGGDRTFAPVLHPTGRRGEASFPSGHASAGYAVLALYFALRGWRPRLAWAALAAGVALGAAMGWARILQGGHWFSDTLWSGAIVYFCAWGAALALNAAFARGTAAAPTQPSAPDAGWVARWRPVIAWGAGALGALIVAVYIVTHQPMLRIGVREAALPPSVRTVQLTLSGPLNGYRVQARPGGLRVYATLSGRGVPWTSLTDDLTTEPASGKAPPANTVLRARYTAQLRGQRDELSLRLVIGVPPGVKLEVVQEPREK